MKKTLTLYCVYIRYKDTAILWRYGEPRSIEFLPNFIRIGGVGVSCEYPYKGMLEFHMNTKEEAINLSL